jgi:hypothetical protein
LAKRPPKAGEIGVEQRVGHVDSSANPTGAEACPKAALSRGSSWCLTASFGPELDGHIEVAAHPREACHDLKGRDGFLGSPSLRLAWQGPNGHAKAAGSDSQIVHGIFIASESLGQRAAELAHTVAEQGLRGASLRGGGASLGHPTLNEDARRKPTTRV